LSDRQPATDLPAFGNDDPASAPPAGLQSATLGKYRILESVGRGGMARVYRAYHPQLDRYVAIKVLRSDLAEDAEFRARFQREARAVAALRHPNIVRVHDFDAQDDVCYMVMELLEGDTLKTRLNSYRLYGEQMPWGESIRVLLDILDGLAYAHSEGMIHRDLKSSNILLTRQGQAVIADFGIAQIVGGTQYTATGALMGTVEYMAPEQGRDGHSDARSDIYSLGIVLYEMLTQHPPFEADTPLAVLLKHVNDPLPPLRTCNPAIPEPLERVIRTALDKEPEARYQTAAEMRQALLEAAATAEIALPERISPPRAFTTAEAPSESVIVLSGSHRDQLAAADFADDDTDVTLNEKLSQAVAPASPETPAAQPPIARRENITGKAILTALGFVGVANLTALTLELSSARWSIFATGWPFEFLLCSAGLCLIMVATQCIWLFIPIVLIFGNGVLLSYSTLTGDWQRWSFLWVFELWLIAAAVLIPLLIYRRRPYARRFSRSAGIVLGIASGVLALLVAVLAAGASLFNALL